MHFFIRLTLDENVSDVSHLCTLRLTFTAHRWAYILLTYLIYICKLLEWPIKTESNNNKIKM